MRALLMLAPLALLAACGGKDAGNNSSDSGASASQQEAPDNLSVDPYNSAVPLPEPTATPIAGLPARFAGRWGVTAGDCDTSHPPVEEGLLKIAGDRLDFFEASGTVSQVARLNDDTVTFRLAMQGEGRSWTEPTRLTLTRDGGTLVRQTQGDPSRAGAFTYRKCPA